MDTSNIILILASQVFAAGAVYGAIRADLKNLHKRLQDVNDEANHAHRRIDDILMAPKRR